MMTLSEIMVKGVPKTLSAWNLDFSPQHIRRRNMRRTLRLQSLDLSKRGKGSKAWKRVDAMDREPGTLIWPDYAL